MHHASGVCADILVKTALQDAERVSCNMAVQSVCNVRRRCQTRELRLARLATTNSLASVCSVAVQCLLHEQLKVTRNSRPGPNRRRHNVVSRTAIGGSRRGD